MSNPEAVSTILPRVMPIRIVIPGQPATYQKKVATWQTRDGSRSGTHAYDAKGYKQWRDYARGRAAEICEGTQVSDAPVLVRIGAYFLPPKSLSKKLSTAALAGYIRPLVKDCDNIAKAVQDSCLTGICIRDDRQIVSLTVDKFFSNNPRVEIVVTQWLPAPSAPLFEPNRTG